MNFVIWNSRPGQSGIAGSFEALAGGLELRELRRELRVAAQELVDRFGISALSTREPARVHGEHIPPTAGFRRGHLLPGACAVREARGTPPD